MTASRFSLSRRRLLGTGAATFGLVAAPHVRRASADDATTLRIGAILPIGGTAVPVAGDNRRAVGEAARMGLLLGEQEYARNAQLLGRDLHVVVANAPNADAAHRAAQRLVSRDGVSVLLGGFSLEEALAIGEVAEEHGVLFLNIGAVSDALRTAACRSQTFHVEASAAMYLDAIVGWFVRAGHRTWHFVQEDSKEGNALYERTLKVLTDRHWGGREAGRSLVEPGGRDFEATVRDIRSSAPDVVLVLTDWLAQLDFLARYETERLPHPVTGLPEPAAQLRDFFATSRRVAPQAGLGHRAMLWEATLDAYGARELNDRFQSRWGRPMDPPAWTAYQSVKIAFEAGMFGGSLDGRDLARHLTSELAIFDIHKGIGVSFRPWDHQLRQSLYLVQINPAEARGHTLAPKLARASLVGELPAIYMPGTDPVERLDQLGDIRRGAACA